MTYKELFCDIVYSISKIADSACIDDDFDIYYEDSDISELINHIKSISPVITASEYNEIIERIENSSDPSNNPDIDNDIIISKTFKEHDYNNSHANYNRKFYQIESEISLIDSDVWNNTGGLSFKDETWKLFVDIAYYKNLSTPATLEMFLTEIIDPMIQKCFLFIDPTITINNFPQLYSYSLLMYLNKNEILPLNPKLAYSRTTPLSVSLRFDPNVKYEQYREIYDVINELNQADNLLDRFLKLYHILEFMTFRLRLKEIINRISVPRSILNQIHNLSKKVEGSESRFFKQAFRDLFNSDMGVISSNLSSIPLNRTLTNYLNDTFETSIAMASPNASVLTIDQISTIIYKIRCNIVHNKDGEQHFTTTYFEDFDPIIDLMRVLLKVFEELIIDKLNTHGRNPIEFSSQTIGLY